MRTVWFIRHGESEANAGLPTTDPVSTSLTKKGFEQAKSIAASFQEPPSLIVTSSYVRTKQTAWPTVKCFPDTPQEEWPVHEFTYLSLTNKQSSTVQQRRPLVQQFWHRNDPFYIAGEGAESFVQFMLRVQAVIERISQQEDRFIAIFSHEQFIRGIMWSLLLGTAEKFCNLMNFRKFLTSFSMPNGAVWKVQFCEKGEIWSSNFVCASVPKADVAMYPSTPAFLSF